MSIYPRCKADFSQVYVTVEGDVLPCSWIGNGRDLVNYRKFMGETLKDLNLKTRKLAEITADPKFKTIENTWQTSQPFGTCAMMCSEPCDAKDRVGTNERTLIRLNRDPKP